ncbi:MAG: Gfo/Idh/MocA family oxidoreductase [Cyclobacteriaceae bacterium]
MKNFAITGVAGYIAPRHLEAIHKTGNRLIAAVDPHDSVGILDSYSDAVSFFTEIERFDRHLETLRRTSSDLHLDFLSVCSPNYLHDAHIRLALRLGADAICEKPLVANPWHLDFLGELEAESGKRVYTILQVRLHPSIIELKAKLQEQKLDKKYELVLSYITARGPWYYYSWKGDVSKSGGLGTNIGIHFFDMLIWLFGSVERSSIHLSEPNKMAGLLELKNANVRWFLSTDRNDLPAEAVKSGKPSFRSITINDDEIDFNQGFTDLHVKSYKEILQGNGFTMEDARPSIELVSDIRNAPVASKIEYIHPFVEIALSR